MPLPERAPVLIVDDDELVRRILRQRLERLDIPVMTAASAEEALAAIEISRVAALVLDLSMPGQSGLDLAEFVRLFGSHLSDVPILIFTGTTLSLEMRDQARRFNADVYLKPEGLDALLQRLAVLVDSANQTPRLQRPRSGRAVANSGGETGSDFREPES